MNLLTAAPCLDYSVPVALIGGNGFGHSLVSGANAMRRKAHGFFYAPRFFNYSEFPNVSIMAGGVLGGCKAWRFLNPFDQPDTSSAALSLVTSVGGFKPFVQESPMKTQSPATPELRPELAIINGEIKTTSLKIAEHFGKPHYRILRAIDNLHCSPEFNAANFGAVEYEDAKGEKQRCYEITRDGFAFLAMGFTGAKAAQWKEAYITAFNRMEAELQSSPQDQPINPETITLTQAELDALVNERVAKALPAPSAEFAPEVLAAIESRAQALSLRHYDHTKKQIIKAVGQHGDKSPDTAALVNFIGHLGLPDSQLVLVHRDTLWRVTNCFAALQKAFSAVDVLEKETGLDWYSRG